DGIRAFHVTGVQTCALPIWNTSETDLVQWQTAEEALADWRSGRCILLPPTWSQLSILSGFATVADLMAADPVIEPILPIMGRRRSEERRVGEECAALRWLGQ